MSIFVSLSNASSVQEGSVLDLGEAYADHSFQVSASGTSTLHVDLYGSLNGVNWTLITTATSTGLFEVDKVVRYLRADLSVVSGASPSVTAVIASATASASFPSGFSGTFTS